MVALGATGGGVGVLVARTAGSAQVAEPPERPTQPPRTAVTDSRSSVKARDDTKPVPLSLLRRKPPDRYVIVPGDILAIYIEGVLGEKDKPPPITMAANGGDIPVVGYPIPVDETGHITLPLIGSVQVSGDSIQIAQSNIVGTYVKRNILVGHERALVTLLRPRSFRVVVVRRDISGAPSQTVHVAAYENDILHALVKSGGVPAADADAAVIIQRRGTDQKGSPVSYESRVPLRARAGEPPPKDEDVELYNGDVVIVESRAADQKLASAAESPPMLTFAVAAPDGRVLVQLPGVGGNGPWQLLDTAKVTATEADGKAVDAKSLIERLRTMTTVLVATDGRAPTAAHLQAVKPGTLVLTVQSTH